MLKSVKMQKKSETKDMQSLKIFIWLKMGVKYQLKLITTLWNLKVKKSALTVVRDITERKKAEEQLKETIEELRTF